VSEDVGTGGGGDVAAGDGTGDVVEQPWMDARFTVHVLAGFTRQGVPYAPCNAIIARTPGHLAKRRCVVCDDAELI